MSAGIKNLLTVIFFASLLVFMFRLLIPYKIKRIIRKTEHLKANLNNKNVVKYISFLRSITIINVPEVGNAIREVQLMVNGAEHIDGKLKLKLYNMLMRKRVMGLQEVNPIYVDKNGRQIQ